MRFETFHLLIFVAAAAALVAAGVALMRVRRVCLLGGAMVLGGVGLLCILTIAQLTGRLGVDQVWFRAPSFAVAAAVLAATAIWWLRRPGHPLPRFGFPVAVVGGIALAIFAGRLDGRGTPLAVLMPTLEKRAPELTWFDDAGHRRTLDELRGQVVLVNFWATWCTPCRREMPMLSKLQREYEDRGLVVLYLSMEEPEILEPFLAVNHFDGAHGRLDRAADFYGAGKIFPLSFLISRDGRVSHRWSGRPQEEWLTAQVVAQL